MNIFIFNNYIEYANEVWDGNQGQHEKTYFHCKSGLMAGFGVFVNNGIDLPTLSSIISVIIRDSK